MMKVPHMLILGNAEMDEKKISVRLRDGETKNNLDFLNYLDILSFLNDEKSINLSDDSTRLSVVDGGTTISQRA